ncbi:MAG: hypothetical protein AB1486_09390 [Planctomycetota bacterium]
MVEPRIVDELERMKAEYEPLLPIEERLIVWSLLLGIVLIGVLVWVSRAFF